MAGYYFSDEPDPYAVQLRLDRRDYRGGGRAGLPYWGVVQAFADSSWRRLTAREERHMLCQWATSRESGHVVFSWTWAGQNLSNQPRLLRGLTRFSKGSLAKCRRHGH